MCTCMWSAKTLTLRVWRTKNTGTRSQQIISLSLEVRALGGWGLQEFHTMALRSFSVKFVSINLPLSSLQCFQTSFRCWRLTERLSSKTEAVTCWSYLSAVMCVAKSFPPYQHWRNTSSLTSPAESVFEEWKQSVVLICFELGTLPVLFFSSFEKNKTCHMSVLLSVLAGFQLFWIVFFDCSICEDSAFWMMHTKAQACFMFVIKYFQRTELWCFF